MKLKSFFILISLFAVMISWADEGMWIPALLQKYNEADMYKKGMKISAEDIYSVNHASLKDAIVLFGRGCTGEIVSDEGLILTNHHCGYGQIQSHSSVEHDYLTNGFWATSKDQEMPCPGLIVTFLIRMEDVTSLVLKDVTKTMSENERALQIEKASKMISEAAIRNTHYAATVKPLYYGNQYFLYVMEVYKDIRFVGAPPSAIGKFGGDTDNWVWPRHTGDFSMFRIYANKDNEPAEYAKDNIPYKPKKHFVISLKGVKENDFTMVYGYPFTTQEYLPSYAVKMISETDNPIRIMIRTKKLGIIDEAMKNEADIRIKYSAKQAGIANGWKKWMGENNGLKKTKAIERKIILEKEFLNWLANNPEMTVKYGNLLTEYEMYYNRLTPMNRWEDYFFEAIWNDDLIGFTSKFRQLAVTDVSDTNEINKIIKGLKNHVRVFFRDFDLKTEKKLFLASLLLFYEGIDKTEHPDILLKTDKKFKGDFIKYNEFLFKNSVFADEKRITEFLNSYNASKKKALLKDPAFILMSGFINYYFDHYLGQIKGCDLKIDSLNRLYMAALMEMQSNKLFYPDANATLRVTYGKVEGMQPNDGIKYLYYTTIDGIMEKDNPEIDDYIVPEKLRLLWKAKDYGRYGVNGTLPIAFIASNHTTGGNSGSPVLNAEGQLIGINFDRNWEGTMSDLNYDVTQCRNISIDIRYCLFVIDKYAGAKNLVDEMEVVE